MDIPTVWSPDPAQYSPQEWLNRKAEAGIFHTDYGRYFQPVRVNDHRFLNSKEYTFNYTLIIPVTNVIYILKIFQSHEI